MRIHKQQFQITDYYRMRLPFDAKILKVDTQHNNPTLWYAFADDRNLKEIEIMVVGTGNYFNPSEYKYLDTIFIGPFVWHIYYREV